MPATMFSWFLTRDCLISVGIPLTCSLFESLSNVPRVRLSSKSGTPHDWIKISKNLKLYTICKMLLAVDTTRSYLRSTIRNIKDRVDRVDGACKITKHYQNTVFTSIRKWGLPSINTTASTMDPTVEVLLVRPCPVSIGLSDRQSDTAPTNKICRRTSNEDKKKANPPTTCWNPRLLGNCWNQQLFENYMGKGTFRNVRLTQLKLWKGLKHAFFFVTRSQERCLPDAADVVQTQVIVHSSANIFQSWWPTSSEWLSAISSEKNITVNKCSSPALEMHKQHPLCVNNFIYRWTPITNISNIALVSFGCLLWSLTLPSSLLSSSFSTYCMF